MLFEDISSLVRTLVIGTLAYTALVLLLRFSGKRTLSKWNAFDLVVTVALGSSLATALLSKTTSLLQGTFAFALLIVLQLVVTWFSVRSRRLERWVKAEPRLLLHNGQLLLDVMRAERVSQAEIRAAVREHGLSAVEDVYAVILETDGSISVIPQCRTSTSALAGVAGFPD